MRLIFFLTAILSFFTVSAQNYLGFSKQYILKAMKSQRKDMSGPVSVKDGQNDYITYVSKQGGSRAVFYHFKLKDVDVSGENTNQEICIKYVSITKCQSLSKCPELEEVTRSLDSHFTKEGNDIWTDYSKKIPQQWIVVKDEDHFEVHVTEVNK